MAQNASDATIADCVRAWSVAVAGLSRQPTGTADVEQTLAGLARRLVDVLHDQPFAVEPAYHVGAALVDAGLTDPEVLARTIDVLDQHLAGLVGRDDAQFHIRLVRVLGAVGTGFARALQQRAGAGQRACVALAGAPVGVAVTDPHGRLTDVNRTMADLLDYDAADLVGRRLTDLVHRDDVADVAEQLAHLTATDAVRLERRLERRLVRRDGAARWLLMAMSVVRDEDGGGDGVAIVAQDVTDHHRLELKLRHQAQHDPLTGLPNRALFTERLDRLFHPPAAAPGVTVGLCFLDLDGFKAINDGLGHQIGDQLLTAVADRINRCVTADGHLVARIGGDEFVMLVADQTGPGTTAGMAEKVLRTLDQPFRVGDHELPVSASIGVVEREVSSTTPAELLWDADVAMRRAKAAGKGRWAVLDLDRTDPGNGGRFAWLSPLQR
jgi:diguanylate cyclase (GGDEF)-like protein/PAS domain S-box-containing protein